MTYNLYKDNKFTVWGREYYTIEADTKEEAIKMCRSEIGTTKFEILHDTLEYMSKESNDGQDVEEIYDKKTNELLYSE